MTLLCQIFKSSCKPESYLYVDKARGLQDVPESLLQQFKEPEAIMMLALTPDKKLARANAAEVISDIKKQGFHLQMPPTAAQLLARDAASD